MDFFEGYEGTMLYGEESTPGTVASAINEVLGIVKNVNPKASAQMEDEGGVGTPEPISLEEGITEASGSCEFLPVSAASLQVIERDANFKLKSYTVHSAAGKGVNQVGCMFGNLKLRIDGGKRLTGNLDWMALSDVPVTVQLPMLVVDEPPMNWIECVHDLSHVVSTLEISVAQNLNRRSCVPNTTAVFPVAGQKRTAFAIKPRHQRIVVTPKFYEFPDYDILQDIIAEIAQMDLVCTPRGNAAPFTVRLLEGKPNEHEINIAEQSDVMFPFQMHYKRWKIIVP